MDPDCNIVFQDHCKCEHVALLALLTLASSAVRGTEPSNKVYQRAEWQQSASALHFPLRELTCTARSLFTHIASCRVPRVKSHVLNSHSTRVTVQDGIGWLG